MIYKLTVDAKELDWAKIGIEWMHERRTTNVYLCIDSIDQSRYNTGQLGLECGDGSFEC